MNFMNMNDTRCMVLLVMSLQMWIKLNQYYHIYHMIMWQSVHFLIDILLQITSYVKKYSSKYGDCHFMRFNQNDIIQKFKC
jgi:hypothetical protein